MKKPNILVVGSLNMDLTGTTEKFPMQGETVFGNSFTQAPGGKGSNQAVQIAKLGANSIMIGKIGKDANGEALKREAVASGVNIDKLLYDDNVATGCAIIILEQNEGEQTKNRILVIPGSNMTIKDSEVEFLEKEISDYDMVVLQNEIPMEINEIVAEYAHSHNVPVMLNPAPSQKLSEKLLKNITYISPNEHEAYDVSGIMIEHTGKSFNIDQAKEACSKFNEMGVKNVLITLGEAGVVLKTEDNFYISPCAENINAIDPTAAGDSFIGAFCTGIACGWKIDDVLTFANHTAALTVSKIGAQPALPYLSDVEELLSNAGINIPDTTMLK